MATGITKREQHSKNAITALKNNDAFLPLPGDEATATLTYPQKAKAADVLLQEVNGFAQHQGGEFASLEHIPVNSFVLGDNLSVLNALRAQNQKVRLFYLDPPYGTGFDFQSRDLEHAYCDSMGTATYVEFMRRRLIVMKELLADDGSIYVHIGHQMLGHMKIIMDEIFGADNCRNIISRRKCSSKNFTRNQYANVNDFILFYSKSNNYVWNQPGTNPDEAWIQKEYPKRDKLGRRYKLVPVHAPGTRNGETGESWRGMMPPPGKHWQYTPSKLEEFDRNGDIHWSRNGNPRRKVYWSSDKKMALTDYWDQFRDAYHQSIKITGYPTEKNFDMLKMIIGASSNPGDLVIDPFCGSGTTIHAARDLGRDYIGIDASFTAAKTTLKRLKHGLQAMGDYVKGREGNIIELQLAIDEPHAECNFIVDESLIEDYPKELGEISEI